MNHILIDNPNLGPCLTMQTSSSCTIGNSPSLTSTTTSASIATTLTSVVSSVSNSFSVSTISQPTSLASNHSSTSSLQSTRSTSLSRTQSTATSASQSSQSSHLTSISWSQSIINSASQSSRSIHLTTTPSNRSIIDIASPSSQSTHLTATPSSQSTTLTSHSSRPTHLTSVFETRSTTDSALQSSWSNPQTSIPETHSMSVPSQPAQQQPPSITKSSSVQQHSTTIQVLPAQTSSAVSKPPINIETMSDSKSSATRPASQAPAAPANATSSRKPDPTPSSSKHESIPSPAKPVSSKNTPAPSVHTSVKLPVSQQAAVSSHEQSSKPAPSPPAKVASTAASTITSVSVVKPSNPPTTMIVNVTSSAHSTFAVPVAVTVTNSTNGHKSLITPAVVTVMSTSTEPDGSLVTSTQLVANPPTFQNGQKAVSSGFFNNQGAVAGVFTVVGIAATSIIVGLAILFRRKRRSNRRNRWLKEMRQQGPHATSVASGDPFLDPSDPPAMRSLGSLRAESQWGGQSNQHMDGGDESRSTESHGLDLTGIGSRGLQPDPYLDVPYHPDDRFPRNNQNGLTVFTDRGMALSRPSLAQSSPSIYPPTLPPLDHEKIHSGENTFADSNFMAAAPPRPPRSRLREIMVKYDDYTNISETLSAHSHSKMSPASSDQDHTTKLQSSLSRKTILDVQRR